MRHCEQDPILRLALQLQRLPGLGERSAQRLASYLIKTSQTARSSKTPSLAQDLAQALLCADEEISLCEVCFNFTLKPRCAICDDLKRRDDQICIVGDVTCLRAIEHAAIYQGRYHVLHGKISPLDGVGPEALHLPALMARLTANPPMEVIVALSCDVDGETTALYLASMIKPLGLKVTRLASGIPLGGELEYIDKATLARALLDRRELSAGSF